MTPKPKPLTLRTPERVEGWFHPLEDGRMEMFLKGRKLKLRCSGTEEQMNILADFFEEQTGLSVNGPDSGVFTRRRQGPKPMEGQLDLLDTGPIFPDVIERN